MKKENIAPWMKQGRWYHIFAESDGSNVTITESDLEVQHSADYVQMPEDFHLIDAKFDINLTGAGTAKNMSFVLRCYADGRQGTNLPDKTLFDWAHIWVFGYFDRD